MAINLPQASAALAEARVSGDIGDILDAALAGVYTEIDADASADAPFSESIRARFTAGRSAGIGYGEGWRAAMRELGVSASVCSMCGREVDEDGYLYTPMRAAFMTGGENGCQHHSRAWERMVSELDA